MKRVLIIAVILVVAVAVLAFLLLKPPGEETVEITLYAGEINNSTVYAYGFSRGNLTSPGPTLKVKVGSVVKLTLINVGALPHVFVVHDRLEENPNIKPLFENAQAGSVLNPVMPGESLSTVFKITKPGKFYYLCTIPGHVKRGMYGTLIAYK